MLMNGNDSNNEGAKRKNIPHYTNSAKNAIEQNIYISQYEQCQNLVNNRRKRQN